jgi:hypothetical protein
MALNLSGRTEILQSNGARVVLEDVEIINDNRLVGGAFTGDGDGFTAGYLTLGHVTATSVDFEVQWTHARGHYSGQLDGSRRLSGTAFDVQHPGSQATWVATRQF